MFFCIIIRLINLGVFLVMSSNSISDWSFTVEKIKNIEERAVSAHALSITKLMERASAAVMLSLIHI